MIGKRIKYRYNYNDSDKYGVILDSIIEVAEFEDAVYTVNEGNVKNTINKPVTKYLISKENPAINENKLTTILPSQIIDICNYPKDDTMKAYDKAFKEEQSKTF